MIRLLALDIDGTLLDSSGQLPPANREAIARAIDRGIEVALATGRRYDYARPVFEQLPGPLTLILSNGAVVKRRDGETLMKRLLPRAVARQVLAAAPEHRHGAAVTFDRPRSAQIVYQSIDWDHPRHGRFFAANRPFLAEVDPLEDCLTEDPVQVMFTGGCVEMRELFNRLRASAPAGATAGAAEAAECRIHADPGADGAAKRAAIVEESPDHRYSVALTEYEFRDFSLVDVLQAGCSKGTALADWARARGCSRHEVMAIGDNLNDLEMLEFAGRPVVMGNAIPDLRTRGWAVTATNDDAGVARAVETFILEAAS
jgi:hydroxymethylpyrimidine pyrophosphatase-like HAD family hydrolase